MTSPRLKFHKSPTFQPTLDISNLGLVQRFWIKGSKVLVTYALLSLIYDLPSLKVRRSRSKSKIEEPLDLKLKDRSLSHNGIVVPKTSSKWTVISSPYISYITPKFKDEIESIKGSSKSSSSRPRFKDHKIMINGEMLTKTSRGISRPSSNRPPEVINLENTISDLIHDELGHYDLKCDLCHQSMSEVTSSEGYVIRDSIRREGLRRVNGLLETHKYEIPIREKVKVCENCSHKVDLNPTPKD